MIKQEGNKIFVSIGVTANVGNYNSVKVDVGQSVEVNNPEEIENYKAQLLEEVLEFAQTALDVAVQTVEFPN